MPLIENIHYMGLNDRRTALFENMHPIERGISYNSYLILDEKTALIDSVDRSVSSDFLENVLSKLEGRNLDYLIMHHVEPDHASLLRELTAFFPEIKIVGSATCLKILKQFNELPIEEMFLVVKEGDEISFGQRKLVFYSAPMVHWPEVMMSFEPTLGILFSADAFGSFGAPSGHLFSDEVDFESDNLWETRRYYTNIVGKYGQQVQSVLNKFSDIKINMIFPTHGLLWRGEMISFIIDKYQKWSTYTPEESGVVIAYASMYGNTKKVANILAKLIAEKTDKKIAVYDVSKTHFSHVVAESFRFSNIVVAAPTYNLELYPLMATFIKDIAALNLQGRNYSIIGNGTWASVASKKAEEMLSSMKNMTKIGDTFEITSAMKKNQSEDLNKLADDIVSSLK